MYDVIFCENCDQPTLLHGTVRYKKIDCCVGFDLLDITKSDIPVYISYDLDVGERE